MTERLQKVLARHGVASRRGAESLIAAGRVTVNGEIAIVGQQVGDEDAVAVDGRTLAKEVSHLYFALNKPVGVVTTAAKHRGEPTVMDLLPPVPRVAPVGRLDKDTSGLLLFSNDGEWINLVTHPRYQVEKEYDVLVRGHPDTVALERMRAGIEIQPGLRTSPARVALRATAPQETRLSVTVVEGKKRQIRLMTAAVGHPVLALQRVRVGDIRLGTLSSGQFRPLTGEEVESIRDHARRFGRSGTPSSAADCD